MLISHCMLASSLLLLFPFSQQAVEYLHNTLGHVKVFEPLHFWTFQFWCVWNAVFWLKWIYAIHKQMTSWQTPFKRQVNKTLLSHTTHRAGVRKCQVFEQKWTSAPSKEIFPRLKARPQPMPDCTLWKNTAVKSTHFISFSFHDNTAFVISRLLFPASSNLEGFTFLKMCICVQKALHLIFLPVFSLSSFSYKVRMLGSPWLYSLSTLLLNPYQGKRTH